MFDRTIDPDPRPAPGGPTLHRMRDGRRREHGRTRDGERLSFRERCSRALTDVGLYRRVSFRDLAETHFGGRPYAARRVVNAWIREELVKESTARGPKGEPFQVLALTRLGALAARELAVEQGLDPGQLVSCGARRQRSHLAHDLAVYRACRHERRRLLGQGAAIRRVRLEGELQGTVARRSESARVRDGRRAADAERHRAARELGLPINARGRVVYPDVQLEYVGSDGRPGHLNIEVASENYRASTIQAKADAGFVLHASGAARASVLRALG